MGNEISASFYSTQICRLTAQLLKNSHVCKETKNSFYQGRVAVELCRSNQAYEYAIISDLWTLSPLSLSLTDSQYSHMIAIMISYVHISFTT
jgi:hypothetical protein